MLYKPALCLAAALCLAVMLSYAQTPDSLTGQLAHFPTRVFSKIQSQSASLNQQVTSQTQQYLKDMARREQRMQQRLSDVDSNAAKTLFGTTRL